MGVLWPGDSWIPYLNYPAEAPDAATVGRALAAYLRTELWSASVLASRRDRVLKVAYPLGDFVSDLFNDDDAPNRAALGYRGPRPETHDHVLHSQIARKDDYGHFDYLPPDAPGDLDEKTGKHARPIQWLRELLGGAARPSWP